MKLSYKILQLKLKHTFRTARVGSKFEEVVITKIEHDGITGFGEASTSRRYNETIDTVKNFLSQIEMLISTEDPFHIVDIMPKIESKISGNYSAKASVDIALHDWLGKKIGAPLYKIFGLNKEKTPVTDITIGIDEIDVIKQKVKEAEDFPILKVKQGLKNDYEIIEAIRSVTDKPLRIDANEGWTREEAVEKIIWLEKQNVEFIEQPLKADDLEGTRWLREHINIPIIADESVKTSKDIPKLAGIFDGINIKLMKSGGISEAIKMIHTARAFGMKVMLGCMVESSVGITSASHLSPLVDYVDLDGAILTENDPFDGVKIIKGKLILPDRPGVGVIEKEIEK
jgi:L-alanine-DL-glutamate epimerase-like enolase superfamily enzyme